MCWTKGMFWKDEWHIDDCIHAHTRSHQWKTPCTKFAHVCKWLTKFELFFSVAFSHMNHDLMYLLLNHFAQFAKSNSIGMLSINWWGDDGGGEMSINRCNLRHTIKRCTPFARACVCLWCQCWILFVRLSPLQQTWMEVFSSKNGFSPLLTITFSSLLLLWFFLHF